MPPASYIVWILVIVGGAVATLPLTMGISIFLIYWGGPVVGALLVVAAVWRIGLVSGTAIWPAVIVAAACAAWVIGMLGMWTNGTGMTRFAAIVGPASIAACGVAAWKTQEVLSDDELIPPVYGYVLAAIGVLLVVTSGVLIELPRSSVVLTRYVPAGLSILGCVLMAWAVYRMVRAIGREHWIIVASAVPLALLAYRFLGQMMPGLGIRMMESLMFFAFPFLAWIGGLSFWRLSALVSDGARMSRIDALNAGRLAA